MITDVAAWRAELVATGAIVEDGDRTVDGSEAEARFNRYIELLEMVGDHEEDAVFLATVESMTAACDYGAYERALSVALSRFVPERFGRMLFRAVKDGFTSRDADRAGDWLGQLAFRGTDSPAVLAFNVAWADDLGAVPDLLTFVQEQESDGWLSAPRQRCVLRPTSAEGT